jgi:hypothetical protein
MKLLFCCFFLLPLLANAQTEKITVPAEQKGTVEISMPRVQQPSISGPTTICKGGETILKAEGDYEHFEWNNGATDRFIKVREEGVYEVTVITKGGCRLTSSVVVRVIPCT